MTYPNFAFGISPNGSPSGDPLARASRRLHPLAVLLDELDEPIIRFLFRDVALDAFFPYVQTNLARPRPDVAEVGVGHFAWAVDNASHDGDLDVFEVRHAGFDVLGSGLQVKQRAATGRARNEYR